MSDCCGIDKTITRGNQAVFRVTLKQNNIPIIDLASATKIVFALVSVDTGDAAIEETSVGGSNPKIAINTPTAGIVQVTEDSPSMLIDAGLYHVSVEIWYSPTNKLEWVIRDAVRIMEDFIS